MTGFLGEDPCLLAFTDPRTLRPSIDFEPDPSIRRVPFVPAPVDDFDWD